MSVFYFRIPSGIFTAGICRKERTRPLRWNWRCQDQSGEKSGRTVSSSSGQGLYAVLKIKHVFAYPVKERDLKKL